jgi:lipopolysaccharide biosynthesis glycosyltransferase
MELLKLRAYQLHEYRRVLLLDLDAMLVQNLDHLFEDPAMDKSLLFTYDHAMANSEARAPPVQGGFLLITPSEKHFEGMVEVVREGDFRDGSGWGGSKIGWAWGGQTIQGLVSYYYNMLADKTDSLELDHCEYNSMATTKDCRYMDWEKVQSIHFTWCQKPWECHKGTKPICEHMHTHWWNTRRDFELANGLEPGPRCCGDTTICPARAYQKIKLEQLLGSR